MRLRNVYSVRVATILQRQVVFLQFQVLYCVCAALLWGVSDIAYAQTSGADQSLHAYENPALPVVTRVNDLISRMTLEEKVSQMEISAQAIPRLDIPYYNFWSEAAHGICCAGYATVFPQVIGMAATFDAPLIRAEGEAVSIEGRAKYNEKLAHGLRLRQYGIDYFAPNINILRDPRWGRSQETFGEDPYLTSKMSVAYISGIQGDDPTYLRGIATPKHFAVHSGPEAIRTKFDAAASPHDLADTYFPAFKASITEGHAAAIMCAFTAINGEYDCANSWLLKKTLRDDWSFKGYVVTDCGAIGNLWKKNWRAKNPEDAAAMALNGGTDLSCGDEFQPLVQAVKDGRVSEREIDAAVTRVLTARFRLGMFDPPDMVPFNKIPPSENNSLAHRLLALHVANESLVLLKNDGILPFTKRIKNIAVVGPSATTVATLEGNYNGTPLNPVLPLEGIEERFKADRIVYAQGSAMTKSMPYPVPFTVLHPSAGSQQNGLEANYFNNAYFAGKPVLRRIDRHIDFDWDKASPVPGLKNAGFSVRWTGVLVPNISGTYQIGYRVTSCFACFAHYKMQIYLDGKLLDQQGEGQGLGAGTQAPLEQAQVRNTAKRQQRGLTAQHGHEGLVIMSLVAGRRYTLCIEFMRDQATPSPAFVWYAPPTAVRARAVAVAKEADVTVAFVGLSSAFEAEDHDRTSIDLPQEQEELLKALGATGKPLVVVLMNGGPLSVNWAKAHAAAVLEAWYPGVEGGNSIAATLAGDNNPAGRLPYTIYKSLDQLPSFDDYAMDRRTYRYFRGESLFPFGFGLSYTTFRFSDLRLTHPSIRPGEPLDVSVDVTNTGKRAGDEVSELYLDYHQRPGAPNIALKGFQRTHLIAGETETLHFTLSPQSLQHITPDGNPVESEGAYTLNVGGSQPGIGSSALHEDFDVR